MYYVIEATFSPACRTSQTGQSLSLAALRTASLLSLASMSFVLTTCPPGLVTLLIR